MMKLFRHTVMLCTLLFSLLTVTAIAETSSGWCGKNSYSYTEYDSEGKPITVWRNDHVQWEYIDGELYIWGNEDMEDYIHSDAPWPHDITSVTIGSGVTSVGAYAFVNCPFLTSFSMSGTVCSVGKDAFQHCDSLTSITVPGTVSSWGSGVFSLCEGLTSVVINSSEIAEDMFLHCDNLTSVEIGSNVSSIGRGSFSFCEALEQIVIPGTVQTIGETAFAECSNLKNIILREGVRTINACAFQGCTSLKSLIIPNSVTYIGSNMLHRCTSLTSLSIPFAGSGPESDGFYNIIDLFNLVIGESGEYALTNVTLTTTKPIPDHAFSGAPDALTNIILPEGLDIIGNWAFYGTNITEIHLPESLIEIGEYAFGNCKNLTSVAVPSHVKIIGDSAFSACSNLINISIPESVEQIGSFAFAMTGLKEFTLSKSNTEVGEKVFAGCSSLETLTMPLHYNLLYYFHGEAPESLKKVTVTDVETIPSFSNGCSHITTIVLPDGVKELGYGTFACCSSLEDVYLPEGIVSIGDCSFYHCVSLTDITLPESVTSIGSGAFEGCSNLKTIALPEALTSLGSGAFMYCSSLTSIDIPDELTALEGDTFACCEELQVVNIRSSSKLEFLRGGVFWQSNGLRFMTLPDSIKEIDDVAIPDLPNLTIRCNHYSTADWYAKNANISVSYLDAEPETLVTLHLPESTREIQSESFLGTAATGAEIPEGCIVENRAFADSNALCALFVTGMEVALPADVIQGSQNACVYCYPDSQAAADCAEYGILYKLLY